MPLVCDLRTLSPMMTVLYSLYFDFVCKTYPKDGGEGKIVAIACNTRTILAVVDEFFF